MTLGKNCCGCYSCEQICPKSCITFKRDNEGFMYPFVNENDCISCGACIKHCPILSIKQEKKQPTVFAAKYKNRDLTFKSTSGGVFIAFANYVLEKGGIVFGCAYDENLVAHHIGIENKKDLYKLQSSKYVQSDIQNIYSKIKNELSKDRYVLFSGTGCQSAGLMTFLGKEYDKLINIDILCHGVPSPELFKNYINYMGKKLGGNLTEYNFRSKEKRGWDLYYKASNNKHSKSDYGFFDPYYNAFLNCKTYRESCYNCKFANTNRISDITLGDYWGIKKMHPEFYDNNGVSVVLLNREKGTAIWNKIKQNIDFIPSTVEKAAVMNGNLVESSKRPLCRDTIYDGFDGDFDSYINTKLAFKINPKTKIKKMIPVKLKDIIKKYI